MRLIKKRLKSYFETKLGKLYHGDCLNMDIVKENSSIDLVLTDPPYDEITHHGAMTGSEKKFGIDFKFLDNPEEVLDHLLIVSNAWVLIFCSLEMLGKYQSFRIDKYVRGGVWDRVISAPQMSGDRPGQGAEGIAIFHSVRKNMKWNGRGKHAIWRFPVERGKKVHPTQKPLALIQLLISLFSDVGHIVYDPFLGGGTTAVACEKLGRRWIGIELDEKYCEIAAKRIEAESKLPRLFNAGYIKQKKKKVDGLF